MCRKSIKGESRYVWRGLASELRERESCKVISVRSLGGRHGISELCPLVLNFANAPQTSDQRWFELAERRTGASQGQKTNVLGSKTAQKRFQNGAKSPLEDLESHLGRPRCRSRLDSSPSRDLVRAARRALRPPAVHRCSGEAWRTVKIISPKQARLSQRPRDHHIHRGRRANLDNYVIKLTVVLI